MWVFTWGKQRDNRAFWRGCRSDRASGGWEWGGGVGGWRWDDFTGGGKLEGQVQHCLAITPGLQVEGCWTPLPPEVDGMAELVLDETVGSCRPTLLEVICMIKVEALFNVQVKLAPNMQ